MKGLKKLFNLPARNLPVFICIFTAVALAYLPSLRSGFIMDDESLIVKNSYIKDISLWPRIFSTDIFHFHPKEPAASRYYRPLQSLSYALEYPAWKLNPAGYRFTNLFIHAMNAFLFFLLLTLLFKDRTAALLSAVIFSLLPIHPCLVTYVAGRSDLLQTLFLLLSMLSFAYFHSGERPRLRTYLGSLAFFVLALLTREGALLLPLLLAFCVLFMKERKKGFLRVLAFAALAALYLLLRGWLMPCAKLGLPGGGLAAGIMGYLRLCSAYFQQMILPLDSQLWLKGHGAGVFFAVFAGALALVFALLVFSRRRACLFGALVFFAGLLPLVNLAALRQSYGSVAAEHYAYIPSMGFALLLAAALIRLREARRWVGRAALWGVLSVYAPLAVVNSANYRDEASFYSYMLRHNPGNTIALFGLAARHFNDGDIADAERIADALSRLNPKPWDMCMLRGSIAMAKSDFGSAESFFKRALTLNPFSGEPAYSLGVMCAVRGQDDAALGYFREAFERYPQSSRGAREFGGFLLKKGLYKEAIRVYHTISSYEPRSVSAHILLGIAFASSGNAGNAEQSFLRALRIDPHSVDALKDLGSLYANMDDYDRAIAYWRRARESGAEKEEIDAFIVRAEMFKGRSCPVKK